MKNIARMVSLVLLIGIISLAMTGCSSGVDADTSTLPAEQPVESAPESAPTDEVPAVSVQLVYFHVANPCDCMAVFGEAVADSVNTNFQAELASGVVELVDVVSDDPANAATVEAFDSQPSDLFVVTRVGDAVSVEPDYEIWGLMGDNEAVAQYVKDMVEAKLAGLA
ncbi:MAG: hypothetical protein JW846_08720 [Dehalococcoidia bacterium]|nr:hypothetical protein [Dehalococcoidia bacterium]